MSAIPDPNEPAFGHLFDGGDCNQSMAELVFQVFGTSYTSFTIPMPMGQFTTTIQANDTIRGTNPDPANNPKKKIEGAMFTTAGSNPVTVQVMAKNAGGDMSVHTVTIPGAPTQVSVLDAAGVAGTPLTVTYELRDQLGNSTTTTSGLTLTATVLAEKGVQSVDSSTFTGGSGAGTTAVVSLTFLAGQGTQTATLNDTEAEDVFLSATGLPSVFTQGVATGTATFAPGAPTRVTMPNVAGVAGTPLTVTYELRDQLGNPTTTTSGLTLTAIVLSETGTQSVDSATFTGGSGAGTTATVSITFAAGQGTAITTLNDDEAEDVVFSIDELGVIVLTTQGPGIATFAIGP